MNPSTRAEFFEQAFPSWRQTFVTLGLVTAAMVLAVLGSRHWQDIPAPTRNGWALHRAEGSHRWLESVIGATGPAGATPSGDPMCKPLAEVVRRFDERLANWFDDPAPRLDAATLQKAWPNHSCERLARRLAQTLMNGAELERVLSASWKSTTPAHRWRTLVAATVRRETGGDCEEHPLRCKELGARNALLPWGDFEALIGYSGVPGRFRIGTTAIEQGEMPLSDDLDQQLLAERIVARTAGATHDLTVEQSNKAFGVTLRRGRDVAITLDADLQRRVATAVRCFTEGPPRPESCKDFQLPPRLAAAGLGIVIVELRSNRIVALAGQLSRCAHHRLMMRVPDRAPVVDDLPCAGFPDERAERLFIESPLASIVVPPGSSMKPGLILAALREGLIATPEQKAEWRALLARSTDAPGSHAQRKPKALAMQVGGEALARALDDLGFGGNEPDWIDGRAVPTPPLAVRPANLDAISPVKLSYATFERIENEIRREGSAAYRKNASILPAYANARTVADTAIGGGNMAVSALGLARAWSRIGRAAIAGSSPAAMHLVEVEGQNPSDDAAAIEPEHARTLIALTRSVTDPAWKGTAHVACIRQLGRTRCPLEGFAGKTGSADFLAPGCRAKEVVPGVPVQYPTKLFGGLFSVDGDEHTPTHAIAAVALRARAGDCLDESNAAAEAVVAIVGRIVQRGLN